MKLYLFSFELNKKNKSSTTKSDFFKKKIKGQKKEKQIIARILQMNSLNLRSHL